ncbi:SGNH/GDSL hydrolase family protein [Metabacillus sp. KIGAM252]|uniref:SGNH/GDSL hydrolase family protein n=1 Tax=Metabacillus flavus TaxID=2823519 RepID=A0ABS5LEP9_9BACI|nr:SGNH/GDSL hydrolase family protein [Metabacillus flavus]MBS2969220.1 SGNH/GDSL hydrolase family protein [Metabacillus flavus]
MPVGKIVFIGDSITDSGRKSDPENLGHGYVRLIRDYYVSEGMSSQIEICNRGVSGNRVTDLATRWERDVINEKPDFLSVSIGINDVWRQLDQPGKKQVLPDEFKEIYEQIINKAIEKTTARLILMQPTVIEEDLQSEGNKKLVPYINTVNELALKYHAILVPAHQAFTEVLQINEGIPLTTDGVHMTSTGNLLMAKSWIHSVTHSLG